MAERPHGTFSRQLFLGETLDTDNTGASYADGVLTLRLSIAERAKPRRVPISVADKTTTTIDDRVPVGVGQVAGMLGVQPAFLRRLWRSRPKSPT